MDTPSLYQNLPLTPSKREIRLLYLQPRSLDKSLRGTLRVVSLRHSPKYNALSYTWGQEGGDFSILLNGRFHLQITRNLHTALRNLRRRHVGILTLWADALCIDQSSFQEKSSQIPLMHDIYQQAKFVLVFLGEPQTDLVPASRFHRLTHRFRVVKARQKAYESYAAQLEQALESSRPRWSDRQWVIQEFVLAREPRLCFGRTQLVYDAGALIDLVFSGKPYFQTTALQVATAGMHRLRGITSEGPHSIADIALETCEATCSDPRDKVLSLLGMIDEREAAIIGSDYSISPAQTYSKATYASIVVQRNWRILELVNLAPQRDANLPSWAVDFSNPELPDHIYSDERTYLGGAWPSATSAETFLEVDLSTDHEALTIRGVSLADIVGTHLLPADRYGYWKSHSLLAQQLVELLQTSCSSGLMGSSFESGLQLNRAKIDAADAGSLSRAEYRVLEDSSAIDVVKAWLAWWDDLSLLLSGHGKDSTVVESRRFLMLDSIWSYIFFASGRPAAFVLSNGLPGIANCIVESGDVVVIAKNAKLPAVLRKVKDSAAYAFSGFAYVYRIMDGELFDQRANVGIARNLLPAEHWYGDTVIEKPYILV